MSNVTRNHKDNVFCLLYKDKKNLLSLYNAVNGTSYEKEEELEVVTLEEAICLRIRNDAAFVIDSSLNLYEQQASVNPNMPLRNLYYVAEELKKIAPPGSLYSTTKAKIPAPRFLVFYNGTAKQPERQIYRLSGESLQGYSKFVEKVREKRKNGLKPEDAVHQAVEECISEGILTEFFREHKEEIVEMSIFEFNQELHDKTLFEDGVAVGKEEGDLYRLVSLICKKMKMNQSLEKIAEDLLEENSVIEPLYLAAEKFAPDYDPDAVFRQIVLNREK